MSTLQETYDQIRIGLVFYNCFLALAHFVTIYFVYQIIAKINRNVDNKSWDPGALILSLILILGCLGLACAGIYRFYQISFVNIEAYTELCNKTQCNGVPIK